MTRVWVSSYFMSSSDLNQWPPLHEITAASAEPRPYTNYGRKSMVFLLARVVGGACNMVVVNHTAGAAAVVLSGAAAARNSVARAAVVKTSMTRTDDFPSLRRLAFSARSCSPESGVVFFIAKVEERR